eukprot:6182420-Pleurochrysis_carterae.AAC.6
MYEQDAARRVPIDIAVVFDEDPQLAGLEETHKCTKHIIKRHAKRCLGPRAVEKGTHCGATRLLKLLRAALDDLICAIIQWRFAGLLVHCARAEPWPSVAQPAQVARVVPGAVALARIDCDVVAPRAGCAAAHACSDGALKRGA